MAPVPPAGGGRTVLQRNALLAVGNLGEPDFLPLLKNCLQDSRPIIRGHGAWALGRLGGRRAREALERALAGEGIPRCKGKSAWLWQEIFRGENSYSVEKILLAVGKRRIFFLVVER